MEVKKQHKSDQKRKLELTDGEQTKELKKKHKSELMTEYLDEKEKYSHLKKDLPKKGASREEFTLNLLAKFKTKLYDAKEKVTSSGDGSGSTATATLTSSDPPPGDDVDVVDPNWLGHELHFECNNPVLAKDAATKEDDWYDVYDPRNPLNKRRRDAPKKSKK